MKHIILRGPRGVGKSTLIRRLLEETHASPGGFVTKKAPPGADGVSQIHIYPAALSEEQRRAADGSCVGACSAGRMLYRRKDVFDTLGVEYLNDTAGRDVLVMDELGFMEAEASEFQGAVLRALDGEFPVLAAVKDKDVPFLREVCAHPNAQVWNITPENRDALFRELLPLLKEAIVSF